MRTTPGAFASMNAVIASGSEPTIASVRILPFRSTTQIAVCFNDTSNPTYRSIARPSILRCLQMKQRFCFGELIPSASLRHDPRNYTRLKNSLDRRFER
jgi:hypothetical protein